MVKYIDNMVKYIDKWLNMMVHAMHLNETIILNLSLIYEYGGIYERTDLCEKIGNLPKIT